MTPVSSTIPEMTEAMPASCIWLPGSGKVPPLATRLATFWALAALQPTSMRPGWTTGSPAEATRLFPPFTMSE
jgi:hypothetical protein